MMRRSLQLLLVIASFAFAACSFAADISTPPLVAPIAPADAYREHIVIGNGGQITNLDPTQINNQVHNRIYWMTHNRLLRLADGKMEPELATEWKWNDDSYTSLNIKLRPGVKFHNGDTLTAEDVAFSLARQTYTLVKTFLDRVEVVGELELNVILKESDVDFVDALSANSGVVVSKRAVEADSERGGAIGTGPWRMDLSSYTPGSELDLVRFDDFWGELPKTERVTFRYISDASTRLIALQNDEIQFTFEIHSTELPIAEADSTLTVNKIRASNILYMAINSRDGAGAADPDLRRAIAHSIDRETLIAAVGDEGAVPAYSMWSWTAPSFVSDFPDKIVYDPEKAKEHAAKAKSRTLRLMANTSSFNYKTLSQVIQEECRKNGITIEIDEVDSAGATANSRYNTAKHEAMLYSIGLFPWDSQVWALFTKGSNSNKAILDSARLNELMAASRKTTDTAERKRINADIQTTVHDECFYIPLYNGTMNAVCRKGVGGYTLNANGVHELAYICMPK